MEQSSLDTSKDNECPDVVVEPTRVIRKEVTAGVVAMQVDYPVDNNDWFSAHIVDENINNDSIVVASACFIKNRKPLHRENALFIHAVTPRRFRGSGEIVIRIGANAWIGQKVRINMMIYY